MRLARALAANEVAPVLGTGAQGFPGLPQTFDHRPILLRRQQWQQQQQWWEEDSLAAEEHSTVGVAVEVVVGRS